VRLPVAVALAVAACVSAVGAQWPNAPSPRLPRNVDGTPNLTAQASWGYLTKPEALEPGDAKRSTGKPFGPVIHSGS